MSIRNFDLVFGTHKMSQEAIIHAIKTGYQILDTATGYKNADIIKNAIDATKDFYKKPLIMTKFNPEDFAQDIEISSKKHCDELGSVPDAILLHSPSKMNEENLFHFKKLRFLFPNRIIGVSNFDIYQLDYLIRNNCKPDIISLEFHPFYQPTKLVKYCKNNDIMLTGYRALAKGSILQNDILKEIALKYNATIPQIVLRYVSALNILPIVSSNKLENIESNFAYKKVNLHEMDEIAIKELNLGPKGSTCMLKFCNHDTQSYL